MGTLILIALTSCQYSDAPGHSPGTSAKIQSSKLSPGQRKLLSALESRGAWIEMDDDGALLGIDLTRPVYQLDENFTYKDLKSLRVFPDLVSLDLSTTAISDAGLEALTNLSKLRVLRLADTEVTGQGLGILTELSELEVLDVSDTKITPEAVIHIRQSALLKTLSLAHNNSITDLSLAQLRGLTQLESLKLTLNPISDAGLEHLEGFTRLKVLDVAHTQITDDGLQHLHALKQLRSLNLQSTFINRYFPYGSAWSGSRLIHMGNIGLGNNPVAFSPFGAKKNATPQCRSCDTKV